MRVLLLSFVLFITCKTAFSQEWRTYEFRNGDLLFQDLDCGPLCDAIEKVTPDYQGRRFSHVGIVYKTDQACYVIEAVGAGAKRTPVDSFILRQTDGSGSPKVGVGRLVPDRRHLIDSALSFCLRQIGKPYDQYFLYEPDSYYCSELIYDALMAANNGIPVFQLSPMTFKDPETQNYFPAWEQCYSRLDEEIPEGQPGCNPGSIANEPAVEILNFFY